MATGTLQIIGNVGLQNVRLPAGTITDAMVNSAAGISPSKLGHQNLVKFAQSGNVASATIPFYVCDLPAGNATVLQIEAGAITKATGSGNCTIDLQKSGVTMLSGNITLDVGAGNRTLVAGVLAGNVTLAPGDWLDLVVTAAAGNGTVPSGLIVEMRINEDAI